MNLMKYLCGIAAALAIPPVCAEEFSWQVAGGYQDMGAASTAESSNSSVRATWYVSAVDDEVGPYELAPFLNRSSYVTVGTSRSKYRERLVPALVAFDWVAGYGPAPDNETVAGRQGGVLPPFGPFPPVSPAVQLPRYFAPGVLSPFGPFPSESGIDTREYAVHGRHVWPGSGWYAGASARRSDADMLPDLFYAQTAMDQESAGLFAGRYFGTRTTLELGFRSESMREELRASPVITSPVFGAGGVPSVFGYGVPSLRPDFLPISLQTGAKTETEDAELSVRHVGELGSSTFSLSASIQSSRTDTRVFVTVPTDIFAGIDPFERPDQDFITGGGQAFMPVETVESERESRVSLSGALFPTRAMGVRLTLSTLDHDTFGASDLVGLSANWFFLRNAAIEVELTRTDSGNGFRVGPTDAVAVRLLGRF